MAEFATTIEVVTGDVISDEAFDALARELYVLEQADAEVTDADLGANTADGTAWFTMTVAAADPGEAVVKALATVRAAIHAAGGATPGWEAHSAVRVAPAKESDRLYAEA